MSRLILGGIILGVLVANANSDAAGVLVLGGLVVVVWALWGRSGKAPRLPRFGRQRVFRVYTQGSHGPRAAANHEGGHFAMANQLGWRTGAVRIFSDGSGYTEVYIPADAQPYEIVALSVAGGVAEGSTVGCGGSWWPTPGSDNWNKVRALRGVPADERARERRRGEQLARSTVGGWFFDGGVSRYADRIQKEGIG